MPEGASANTVKKCKTLPSPKQQHARQRHAFSAGWRDRGRQDEYSCSKGGLVHAPRRCPAYNKTCINCQRRGHFIRCCPQRLVNVVDDDGDQDEEVFVDIKTNELLVNSVHSE